MTNLSIVAVDDEPLALRRIARILDAIQGVTLVGSAATCAEAISLISTAKPDIVALDIRLRDGSGFDIIDALPDGVSPAIIFTTAFDHFAIRAFGLSAVDYVLKPIDADRLSESLDRARVRLLAERSIEQVHAMRTIIENLRAEFHDRRAQSPERAIWVRGSTGSLTRIALDMIDWVSCEDEYVRIHVGRSSHLLRMSIRAFEERLEKGEFVRVHRSALVRVSGIAEIRRTKSGSREVVLHDGTRVGSGRVYAKRLRALITDRAA